MPIRRRVTMGMVAERAGVSPTTVSFVLNDVRDSGISEATRARVLEAVRALGYRPNRNARALSTSRSNAIGFVTDEVASSSYSGATIFGAQERAWAAGKILMIFNTGLDPAVEEAAVEIVLGYQVEGVIYAAQRARAAILPAGLASVPTVLVNCETEARDVTSVMPDDVGGERLATQTLIDAGHRRIGYLGAPDSAYAGRDRFAGYAEALRQSAIGLDHALVRETGWSSAGGYAGTMALVQVRPRPTAIVCVNDTVALGCYDALKALGLRIPDDISVIGFDDQEMARMMRPGLTTIALPHAQLGRAAMTHLLGEREAADAAPQIKLPCPLVARDSLRPIATSAAA